MAIKCLLNGFIDPGARCSKAECRECGWNERVANRRKWRLRQGEWVRNEQGLLYLPIQKKKRRPEKPERLAQTEGPLYEFRTFDLYDALEDDGPSKPD